MFLNFSTILFLICISLTKAQGDDLALLEIFVKNSTDINQTSGSPSFTNLSSGLHYLIGVLKGPDAFIYRAVALRLFQEDLHHFPEDLDSLNFSNSIRNLTFSSWNDDPNKQEKLADLHWTNNYNGRGFSFLEGEALVFTNIKLILEIYEDNTPDYFLISSGFSHLFIKNMALVTLEKPDDFFITIFQIKSARITLEGMRIYGNR